MPRGGLVKINFTAPPDRVDRDGNPYRWHWLVPVAELGEWRMRADEQCAKWADGTTWEVESG